MSYNNSEFPQYMRTAGKITVLTAFTGMLVFLVAFMFDAGTKELNKVMAQTATTSLTVLNTPPVFDLNPYEVIGSTTTSPTNSGDSIQWSAIATDANAADYYLLVCSTNASPTTNNNAAPDCGGGTQWAVSTSTISGTLATVATTTTEAAPFSEQDDWYAWVCDHDATDSKCSVIPEQGDYATSSSPFNVNSRPTLTDLENDGPVDPAGTLVFNSTSTDTDTVGGADELILVICGNAVDYNSATNDCDTNFIASTTISVFADAAATNTLAALVQDQSYSAYGNIVDEHGHEATAQLQADFVVNNVAPTVVGGDITLNGGLDMSLSVPGGETTGFTLDFKLTDANSCENAAAGAEIIDFDVAVFRSDIGTTTCDGTAGAYDANNCYSSGIATTSWNLSCTATSTCAGPSQDYVDYACTFPLWFVADPTDSNPGIVPAVYTAENWSVGIAGSDDDFATSSMATTSSNAVEVISFNAIDMLAYEIAYGGIEPGNDTVNLIASSTLQNIGNTGLDQDIQGSSMCGTYSVATPCAPSASSTIPASEQKASTTANTYVDVSNVALASTSASEIELNVSTTSATSSPATGVTYWGINVPASITLAGSYTGLNTFTAISAEDTDW